MVVWLYLCVTGIVARTIRPSKLIREIEAMLLRGGDKEYAFLSQHHEARVSQVGSPQL
jgi:hypothetical protein